jgi:hypothetical protein
VVVLGGTPVRGNSGLRRRRRARIRRLAAYRQPLSGWQTAPSAAAAALPTCLQVDAWHWRVAEVVSIVSMGVAGWALASLILRATRSTIAAITAPALVLGNPDVLYLQSTPMTEPLLFGTTLLAVELTARWATAAGHAENVAETTPPAALHSTAAAGLAIAAACMTRYEAWPVTGALILLAGAVLVRGGMPLLRAGKRAQGSRVSVVAILLSGKQPLTVGAWFIASGFAVRENTAAGHPWVAWRQVREGVYNLSGTASCEPRRGVVLV